MPTIILAYRKPAQALIQEKQLIDVSAQNVNKKA